MGNDCYNDSWDEGKTVFVGKTKHGNFAKRVFIDKCTRINSYGRGSIEYVIDTVQFGDRAYEIDWENDKFLSLIKGCGTYCWSNMILTLFKKDSIMNVAYSSFDAKNNRIIEINEDGNFTITDLITKKTISIDSQYRKHRKDGYPLFFINIIQFQDNLLEYEIRKEDGLTASMKIQIPTKR
jgi:hypothetical protein